MLYLGALPQQSGTLAVFLFVNVVLYQNGMRFVMGTTKFRTWIWRFNTAVVGSTLCSLLLHMIFLVPAQKFVLMTFNVVVSIMRLMSLTGLVGFAITLHRQFGVENPERTVCREFALTFESYCSNSVQLTKLLLITTCIALYESLCYYVLPVLSAVIMTWIVGPHTMSLFGSIIFITRLGSMVAIVVKIPQIDAAEQALADPLPRWADPVMLNYEDDDVED